MKEDLLENIAEGRVYTIKTIVVSSLFGGLLASSFMIYQNFKNQGEDKKAIITILITTLTLLALIATVFVPALDRIPGIYYTIFFALATSLLAKKYQGSLIEKHISSSGKIYSTGRAVVICIIAILLMVTLLLLAYLLLDAAIYQP